MAVNEILKSTVLTGMVERLMTDEPSAGKALFEQDVHVDSDKYEVKTLTGKQTIASYRLSTEAGGINDFVTTGLQTVRMPALRETMRIPAEILRWSEGSTREKARAEFWIDKNAGELKRLIERRLETSRWEVARTHQLSYTIGSTTYEPDFDVNSEYTGHVDTSPAGEWDAAATDILGDLTGIRRTLAQDAGLAAGATPTIYHTGKVMEYVMENTGINSALVTGAGSIRDKFNMTGAVEGVPFLGFFWVPYEAGAKIDGSTWRPYINGHNSYEWIIVTPPAGGLIGEEAVAPAPDLDVDEDVRGWYSKTFLEHNPSAMWLVVGTVQIPGLLSPNAVYSLQVTTS